MNYFEKFNFRIFFIFINFYYNIVKLRIFSEPILKKYLYYISIKFYFWSYWALKKIKFVLRKKASDLQYCIYESGYRY